jgi:hypothetical protein
VDFTMPVLRQQLFYLPYNYCFILLHNVTFEILPQWVNRNTALGNVMIEQRYYWTFLGQNFFFLQTNFPALLYAKTYKSKTKICQHMSFLQFTYFLPGNQTTRK